MWIQPDDMIQIFWNLIYKLEILVIYSVWHTVSFSQIEQTKEQPCQIFQHNLVLHSNHWHVMKISFWISTLTVKIPQVGISQFLCEKKSFIR